MRLQVCILAKPIICLGTRGLIHAVDGVWSWHFAHTVHVGVAVSGANSSWVLVDSTGWWVCTAESVMHHITSVRCSRNIGPWRAMGKGFTCVQAPI